MKTNYKWTHAMRVQMFMRVVEVFGQYKTWTFGTDSKKFRKFLEEYADGLTKTTGEEFTAGAVKNQIDWAVAQQRVMKDTACIRNWIVNRAAALEADLISYSDLPVYMLTETANNEVIADAKKDVREIAI